jgi:hypothetical protein
MDSDPNTNKTWRKGAKPGGDSMRLSHMQKLISAVDNALNEEGATKNSVLAKFDSMMHKCGETNLVSLGLVTKQARRSTANEERNTCLRVSRNA